MAKLYALNLGEDGRVLSATYAPYAQGAHLVETLPDGDITDYRYAGGAYIYDPLPEPEALPPTAVNDLEARVAELEAMMTAMEEGIANA